MFPFQRKPLTNQMLFASHWILNSAGGLTFQKKDSPKTGKYPHSLLNVCRIQFKSLTTKWKFKGNILKLRTFISSFIVLGTLDYKKRMKSAMVKHLAEFC